MWNSKYAQDTKYFQEKAQIKVKCKHCGHTIPIPVFVDKLICNWCNNYVFRNDEIERRYRFKEMILKERRKTNELI